MIDMIRADRVTPQPWRNGGGQTRELLAWPAGSAADDWQLRISMAEIARDGDFSRFDGIERWFAVVEGHGVLLRFAERRALLTADSEPLAFDGAEAPHAELTDGATTDLNLMLRRSAGRGGMRRAAVGDEWLTTAPLRALFVLQPARLQIDDADAARLGAHSLAWSAHAGRQRWRVHAASEPLRAWWLWFAPGAAT
ncbi:MAG: HutD family protein [Burkholderiaceae bacterium]